MNFNSREKWCRASKDTPQSDCGGIEIAGVKKFLALGVVDNEGTEITAFFDDKSLFLRLRRSRYLEIVPMGSPLRE